MALDPERLAAFYGGKLWLTHADHALRYLLAAAGYTEGSYYMVPGGFALVTRIEQIQDNGQPREPGRWDVGASFPGPFTMTNYLRALFIAPAGHYRIMVFVLTPATFAPSNSNVASNEAAAWLTGGANALPDAVGMRPFSPDVKCTVLIYEFEKSGAADEPAVRRPGLPAQTHLKGARLMGLMP